MEVSKDNEQIWWMNQESLETQIRDLLKMLAEQCTNYECKNIFVNKLLCSS